MVILTIDELSQTRFQLVDVTESVASNLTPVFKDQDQAPIDLPGPPHGSPLDQPMPERPTPAGGNVAPLPSPAGDGCKVFILYCCSCGRHRGMPRRPGHSAAALRAVRTWEDEGLDIAQCVQSLLRVKAVKVALRGIACVPRLI